MKKEWQRILLILLILVIGGTGVYLDLKADENQRQLLHANLAEAIVQNQTGKIPAVDFSVITTFSWDRLYVFGPYTTPEKIDSVLEGFWLGSRFTSIRSSDRVTLIVFTRNGNVVQNLEFPRGQGDFSTADNGLGYSFYEARFVVDERGRMIWVGGK